jgi:DNA polymerase-4
MFVDPPILHADLDAFYASVEQRDDPRLRGRPVIVGGGVVLAASYEAKAYGIRTAMGARQARRLCPMAIVVPPRMSAYSEASKAVFEVFRDTTPLVEALSIDEAFLDVGGLRRISGAPKEIAMRLRNHVRERVGLPITVGVARTKFLAKVASAEAKPDGLLIVRPDEELTFLQALPVERLWGVGVITATKLRDRGIFTVGQVARLEESSLVSLVGRAAGRHLHALAHNRDPRRVDVGRRRRSVGSQSALGRRRRTPDQIEERLMALVDRVTRRLRKGRRLARTVIIRLRFDDFTRATRSHTLPVATARTETILEAAQTLFRTTLPTIEQQGLTLVGVTVTNLEPNDAVQLVLPFERSSGMELDVAIDEINRRYGSDAVTRASLLGRDTDSPFRCFPTERLVALRQDHLGTAEQRNGLSACFGCNLGVPDLCRPSSVERTRDARQIAFERRAEEVALQLDRRESNRALGQVHHGSIAARRIGERDDRSGMEETVGRQQVLGDGKTRTDLVLRDGLDLDAQVPGQELGPRLGPSLRASRYGNVFHRLGQPFRDDICSPGAMATIKWWL